MVSYCGLVETVFKALSDQTRRELLDELFRRDGQTLNALASRFDMTRVAVAKHLRVLEAAGLADLKRDMEATVEKVFEIYIRTTPERLWQAITDPGARARYQFGARVESSWASGSPYQVTHQNAPRALIEGENLEVDPPRRLVQSYQAVWDDDVAADGTSRVTWEIEPVGDSCRLTVTHDQLPEDAGSHLYGGWPMILSGLKTWLETGRELTTPGSLTYGGTT